MKLKFFKPDDIERNIKATVHSTGKLGFSAEAAVKLKLEDNKAALIAIDEDDTENQNLYVKILQKIDNQSFRIIKAGEYFYINTKAFFDAFRIDYATVKIIYDIIEFEYEGEQLLKFVKREVKKKSKKTE